MRIQKKKSRVRKLVACSLAGAMALATLLPGTAYAGGGGGSAGGGGGGSMEVSQQWAYKDNNDGGFGGYAMSSITSAFTQMGVTMGIGTAVAQQALDEANTNCTNRFHEAHPGQGDGDCRVVGVGTMTGLSKEFSGMVHNPKSIWTDNWTNQIAGGTYSNAGVSYTTATPFADQPDTSVNSLVDQYASDDVSIVVIMLNRFEPMIPSYDLSVSTSQQAPAGLIVGAANDVHDVIHADNNGSSIRENTNGTSILHYDGQPNGYMSSKSASKPVSVANHGDTDGPWFSPSDLGMLHWQEGTYWFDVQISKQGRMNNGVDTVDHDPAETWNVASLAPPSPSKSVDQGTSVNGMANTTTIGSRTGRGGYEMHFSDVISPNGVKYDVTGMKVTDASSGTDVSSQFAMRWDKASNTVRADRAASKGEMPLDHLYNFTFKVTVRNPDTDTLADTAAVSWNRNAPLNTPRYEFHTRDPKPNKAWTTDPNEALATEDPNHTNHVGSDGRTFVPGDRVSSVVNGVLPKDLVRDLSQYSLTDDWTGAARYVDFPNAKARVYIDGVDHTADFMVTTVGSKTTATARPSILAGSAHRAVDRKVKLVLDGMFKSEATAVKAISMANAGGEQWNGQNTDSNTPLVMVRSPNPDKVWTTDSRASMDASDPNHTNDVGSDKRTFVPGDHVSATVNGSMPKNLAKDLSQYSISDDWSGAARYVDFPNSNVRVYVGGADRTGDFAISTIAGVTTANAKPAILNGSGKRAVDRKVKLVLDGTFKLETDAHVPIDSIMNKGSEQWNGKTAATNQPTVQVRSPNPDKVWVKDTREALRTADQQHSNNVAADGKTYVTGDDAVVVVNGVLPKNLAKDLDRYLITDDWSGAANYVDFPRAKVYVDGTDRTADFTVTRSGHVTTASAKQTILAGSGKRTVDRKVKLVLTGSMIKDLDAHTTATLTNKGSEQWNGKTSATNQPQVHVWSPNPDKSWVRLDEAGKWKLVIDPGKSNTTGADNLTFLDGDQLGAVVNLPISDPSKLEYGVNKLVLTDDYGKADYLVDPQALSKVRVYMAPATSNSQSSVNAINNVAGSDVTKGFSVSQQGTRITATAKPDWLAGFSRHVGAVQVTMFVPFVANYANGKGAAKVREDFHKNPGEELAFGTDPAGTDLLNAASILVNRQGKDTNLPKICGYLPPVKKDVVGEASQGGSQDSVDGKVVYPGQKLEYDLDAQPHLPLLAYAVKTVAFTDRYDRYLKPDKQTLELMNLENGRMIPKSKYVTKWDDAAHEVVVSITDTALIARWQAGGAPRLQMRFEGTVSADAPVDHKIGNQWVLTVNNSLTPSNEVFNIPPALNPAKHDFQSSKQGDPAVSIDGKTLLLGEGGSYVIDLDATQVGQAYNVWRLGVVDDFDEEYLKVDPTGIAVTGDDGRDYTAKFNIGIRDGVLYAFARQVDTFVAASGETVKGNPQPEDLKAYAAEDSHDPLTDPAIDQTLLGQHYHIAMPYTVQKVSDGYVVKNKAVQIENTVRKETNEVSNPLKPIDPRKDVVVKVGGESANGANVYKDSAFLYQLDSTVLPKNRAYPNVDEWNIVDDLDPDYDRYTGQWAVYATRDLRGADGSVIAHKGDRVAGNGLDAIGKFGDDLFTLIADDGSISLRDSSDSVNAANTRGSRMRITVATTEFYRQLVSRDGTHEQGWRAYIQVKRMKPTERHENQFSETLNGRTNKSNVVWTRTPELTPSLHIEKWDKPSGWSKGDRDEPDDALNIKGDTEIVFTITNTSNNEGGHGALFKASDLKISDATLTGDGVVAGFKYPDGWSNLVLKPGDHVDVVGTLKDVTADHMDRAKVTGIPLIDYQDASTDVWPDDLRGNKDVASSGSVDGPKRDSAIAALPSLDRTDGPKIVDVEGRAMSVMQPVDSNLDDWNGRKEAGPLVATGASVMLVLLLAGVLFFSAILLTYLIRGRYHPRHF